MRRILLPVLFLSLFAGCSAVQEFGPHRIDVQQGNALDQESVARLKPGLSRSQVRFLLGTPLVIDPFRADRWDYVYVYYRAGTLIEQKRISLFFDGDSLARIEGDVPESLLTTQETAASLPPASEEKSLTETAPATAVSVPMAPAQGVAPVSVETISTPVPENTQAAEPVTAVEPQPAAASSIVPPLPSPENAPAYVDPRTPAEPSLQP